MMMMMMIIIITIIIINNNKEETSRKKSYEPCFPSWDPIPHSTDPEVTKAGSLCVTLIVSALVQWPPSICDTSLPLLPQQLPLMLGWQRAIWRCKSVSGGGIPYQQAAMFPGAKVTPSGLFCFFHSFLWGLLL